MARYRGSSGCSRETSSTKSSATSANAPLSGFSDAGTFNADYYMPCKARSTCRPCARHYRKPSSKQVSHGSKSSSDAPERVCMARAELHEMLRHGTLSKMYERISRMTGIPAEYVGGVCVHGLLRMYDGCGYDTRGISGDAKCEARVLRRLRQETGDDGEREACKMGLVKVVAQFVGWCEGCVARMSDREFRDTAVCVVCEMAKGRVC